MNKMKRRLISMMMAVILCLGSISPAWAEIESLPNGEVWFQDFEGSEVVLNHSGEITTEEKHSGEKSLKYTRNSSDNKWDLTFEALSPAGVDASDKKYLVLWVKDTQGNNNFEIQLTDVRGVTTQGKWPEQKAKKDEWTEYIVDLSTLTYNEGFDKAAVKKIKIYEWSDGIYYFDDVYFTRELQKVERPKASVASGTYDAAFQLELSCDTTTASIYYSLDGSVPTKDSMLYQGAITISDSTEVKAVAIKGQAVSDVLSLSYVISSEKNTEATWFQNFEAVTNEQIQSAVENSDGAEAEVLTLDTFGNWSDQAINYQVTADSGSPEKDRRSILIKAMNGPVDVRHLKYLVIPIKDTQGSNGMKVSLIDALGNESDFGAGGWMEGNTKKNTWIQYHILVNRFQGQVDLSRIEAIRIGQWNTGSYYIDDIYFDNYLYTGIPSDGIKEPRIASISEDRVSLASKTQGASVYFTTDETSPDSSSDVYSGPIRVTGKTTVKAVAYKAGEYSKVSMFVLDKIDDKVVNITPVMTSLTTTPGEAYTEAVTIELISDYDAEIYYTTNGSYPGETMTKENGGTQKYTKPIRISGTTTVKAIAVRSGVSSELAEFKYVILPKSVTADKPAGTYADSAFVQLKSERATDIYYTTDGSMPDRTKQKYYKGFALYKTTTVKAVSYYGDQIGEVKDFVYIINPSLGIKSPKISPVQGTYTREKYITMKAADENTAVYYTLDGTTPTTKSTLYKSGFMIKASTVVKAIAVKGGTVSDVAVNEYVIDKTNTPFLKTDGKVLRNNHGSGEVVTLKGTNAGGWLVMENWQCPVNAIDQITTIRTFTERFGSKTADELINLYQDNWWTEEDFDILKASGANTIRLPITYFEMQNLDGTLKQTAFDRLDWFIKECEEREMYVLIDMHGVIGSQNGKDHSGDTTYENVGNFYGNEENIQKAIVLWEAIARRYKDNPWIAGYDLLNEPSATGPTQYEVYSRLYDAIRAIDKNHVIFVQSIWEPNDMPDPDYYGWENVVYEYHFYGWGDTDGDNYDYQKAFIDSKVRMVNEVDYNVPLLVGEFAFFDDARSWDYGVGVFNAEGWSYTSWTYKVTGLDSSWGMYTSNHAKVDVFKDSEAVIREKWSAEKLNTSKAFVRSEKPEKGNVANVLSKWFNTASPNPPAAAEPTPEPTPNPGSGSGSNPNPGAGTGTGTNSSSGGGMAPVKPTPPIENTVPTPASEMAVKQTRISLKTGIATSGERSRALLVNPYIQNGRTMMGIRDAAMLLELGSEAMAWDAKNKAILIQTSNKQIKLVVGQKYAVVNGEKITIDVAPEIKEGRTVLPIAHIARLLGIKIEFDHIKKEIVLG